MKLEFYWIERAESNIKNFGCSKVEIDDCNIKNVDFWFDKRDGYHLLVNNKNIAFNIAVYDFYLKINDDKVFKINNNDKLSAVFSQLFNMTVPTLKIFKMFEKMEDIEGDFEI